MYVLLAVEITSLARRSLPKRVWRRVHMLAFPLWLFSTVHFVTAGTDADDHDRARRDDRRISGCMRSFGCPDRGAHLAHSLACG